MKTILLAVALAVVPSGLARADQGGFTNTGTSVANPAGTLIVSNNTLTFASLDGATIINATFTTNSSSVFCWGGGRGGHITCANTFTGTFSGTLTANGTTQAINGSTSQVTGKSGTTGTTGYNSVYTPFYFSNTGQILRSECG
jgi:hypothetical protein